MSALTEAVPLSSPMVSVTGTGLVVPVKLACRAFASNAYRSVPVGLISAFKFTPLITPSKVNNPPFFLKEPGGRVVVKGPTWRATAWVTGLILSAVLLKVKGERRLKESSLGAAPKSIVSVVLKARKGVPSLAIQP